MCKGRASGPCSRQMRVIESLACASCCATARLAALRKLHPSSERFGWKILTVKRNDCTFTPFGIRHLLDIEFEVDRADDSVAKFLVHQRLQRRAVHLHHFVEAVDGGIGRNTARNAAAHWNSLQ